DRVALLRLPGRQAAVALLREARRTVAVRVLIAPVVAIPAALGVGEAAEAVAAARLAPPAAIVLAGAGALGRRSLALRIALAGIAGVRRQRRGGDEEDERDEDPGHGSPPIRPGRSADRAPRRRTPSPSDALAAGRAQRGVGS